MKKIVTTLALLSLASVSFANHPGKKDHSHHDMKIEKSVKVEIGKKGFMPETTLNFRPNENIVLNITRTTKKTCMKALKHPKTGNLVSLPMNKEVKFDLGSYDKSTDIDLLCGMDMKAGVVHVKGKKVKSNSL